MKRITRWALLLAMTAFMSFSASADGVIEEVVKWSQLPEMGPFGYAFSSETIVPSTAADDFECIGGDPVLAVRWWGSFYEPVPAANPYPNSAQWNDPTTPTDTPVLSMLIGFQVSFYTNVVAGADPMMPWAHPGDRIYDVNIGMDEITELLYGTVVHTTGVEQNVWEYYASLPDLGFEQEEGETYWISIRALHRNESVQWGWQEAIQPGWNADMVQNGYNQIFEWNLVPNKELAFELITREYEVPEPASMLLLSFGALGLFLKRKVRKGLSMKHIKSFIIVFACALFLSTAAFGEEPSVLKWEQLPDMFGYDWSSENLVPSAVADDWLCEDGMPINRIEWWGSYYIPTAFPYQNSDNFVDPTLPTNETPGTVTGFWIGIFDDDDANPNCPWPTPGDLLYLTYVAIENANESLYGVATKPGGQQENVWQYSVALDEFFYQTLGQRYWLAIVAEDGGNWNPEPTFTNDIIQWGWHQTNKLEYGWGEDAVQLWGDMDSECWDLLVDTEMAFRLYTIPEPSTGMIILSSLGLLGLIVRKRSK